MSPTGANFPTVDPGLLLAHLEYSVWATEKTLRMVDQLPPGAVTAPVESSFPSIFATLEHVYNADKYYFSFASVAAARWRDLAAPESYSALKSEWAMLHSEMLAWAREHLNERSDVVLDGWAVWPCWMALLQLVSHGTHHRGQVLTLVRQAGYAPTPNDNTDLIFYYLDRFPQPNQKNWKEAFGITE